MGKKHAKEKIVVQDKKKEETNDTVMDVHKAAGRNIVMDVIAASAESLLEKGLDGIELSKSMVLVPAMSVAGIGIFHNGILNDDPWRMNVGAALNKRTVDKALSIFGLKTETDINAFFDQVLANAMAAQPTIPEEDFKASEVAKDSLVTPVHAKTDGTETEETVKVLPNFTTSKSDPVKGVKYIPPTSDQEIIENAVKALKNGIPGIASAVAEDNPVGCTAIGCNAVMSSKDEFEAVYDMYTGKFGVVCKPCAERIEAQNAILANMDNNTFNQIADNATPSENVDAIRKQYADLIAKQRAAIDEYVKLREELALNRELHSEARRELRKLTLRASQTGKIDQAILSESFQNTEEMQNAANSVGAKVEKASDLMRNVSTELAKFSELHADAVAELVKDVPPLPEEEDERIMAAANAVKNAAITHVVPATAVKSSKQDPYPLVGPEDPCPCKKNKDAGKMYKNCCGKLAFINTRTGKPAGRGQFGPHVVRVNEWTAHKTVSPTSVKNISKK